ncbi:MAG: PAS domain S-box protein [Planctomycetales bacterium]|nr:PAS domain S-box protein [Planctomycetales bacterium]
MREAIINLASLVFGQSAQESTRPVFFSAPGLGRMARDIFQPDPSARLPRWLPWAVIGVCVAPIVLHIAGIDFGTWQRPVRGPASFQLPGDVLEHALLRTVAGSFTHTILQWTAVCLALITGGLALAHYRIGRDSVTAVIGVALVGAGLLDALHTLAADRLIIALLEHRDFVPLTWVACRMFTALILICGACAILIRKPDGWEGSPMIIVLVSLVFGGFAIVLAVFSYNMAQLGYSGDLIKRPYDVPPLILLLFAGGFVLPTLLRGVPNVFSYALLLSAIPHILSQTVLVFGSHDLHDSCFNIGLYLKAIGYGVPLAGLVLDYSRTYRSLQGEIAGRKAIEDALKRNQEALRQSEKQYRDLFENANDLVQCVAPGGSFLYTNRAWRRTLGYSEDEVADLTLLDIIYPDSIISSDSQPMKLDFYQSVMRGEDLERHEVHLLAKDGRRIIVEGNVNAEWLDGRPVASRAIFRDITERKRLEIERDRLFAVSLDMLGIAGTDGYFKRVNPAFQRTFGFPTSEYLSRPFLDFVHPEDRDETKAFFRKLSAGIDIHGFENRCVCQNGTYRWISWTSPASQRGEYLLYIVGHDVTRRKQAEEAQKASEEQFRALVEYAPEAMVVYDADEGQFVSFNSKALDLFGIPASELSDSGPRRISSERQPDGRWSVEIFCDNAHRALEGASPCFEWHCRGTAGDDVPCEVRMIRLPEAGRRLVRVSIADISERRQAEAAARLQAAIVESSDDAVIGKSLDGAIVLWNKGAEKIFGYRADEIVGENVSILLPKERIDEELALLRKIQNGARIDHYETVRTRKDGTQIDVSLAVSPICAAEGKVVGASTIARDITERKRAEEELQRAKNAAEETARIKSDFLANMSHEIRTPMNGVIGMTELALDTHLTDEQREYLQTVKQSADSLLTIINDVLDFSKIEAGRMELDMTTFGLREWLADTLRPFQLRAREKGVKLIQRVERDVPDAVIGDVGRLRQVVVNLIGNALKFTEEGAITVAVDKYWFDHSDVVLHFAVADTGIGIPKEQQSRIFEAFTQADASTTRKYGGTGLGLSICAQLVKLMGGKIWINSKVGHGSTFHFTGWLSVPKDLPETQADVPIDVIEPAELTSTPASSIEVRPLNILLAEDNPVNQELARRLLVKRGHRVEVAAHGEQAIEAVAHRRYDLILMDIQMPLMDGIEATKAIRAQEKETGGHIPIVAMTAHALKEDRDRCLQAGMDDYFAKPINPQRLYETVERLAGASGDFDPAIEPVAEASGRKPKSHDSIARFDLQAALARVDGDAGLLRELADMFIEESPKMVRQLRSAIDTRDSDRLELTAHKLRGALANFFSLGDIPSARRLEEMGQNAQFDGAAEAFDELEQEINRLTTSLEESLEKQTA